MIKETDTQDPPPSITILRATEHDSKDIWEWRKDELTIRMSITKESVDWENHQSWFEQSLVNPNRYLYIGFINNHEKLGMCRFDVDGNTKLAEVAINLNPNHRSKKLSSQLLSKAIAKFCEERSADLVATIRKSNWGSLKCFTNNGFTLESEDGEYQYYKKQLVHSPATKA